MSATLTRATDSDARTRSSPASRRRRPASCTSAARAPRCSTGCSRAITAASSCCASRIPIAPARPSRRSTRSSTGCAGSGSIGTATTVYQFARADAPRRGRARAARAAAMPIAATLTPRRARRDARRARRPRKQPLRIARPLARPRPKRRRGAPFVVRLQGAARRARRRSTTASRARSPSRMPRLDDIVLLRSDGTPTYMLAVVVDDHDMGVTHVIRGDDHLNNAFRQLPIIRAMGWPEPIYAHIPLIHGADGAKLSKRHGALGVDAYRDELGILPEALDNYLLRLGWGHGDDEIISRDQAIEWFDLSRRRQVAVALRSEEAREPQRPLHPRGRRCAPRRSGRATRSRPRRCRNGGARSAGPRDAVPQAARRQSERAGRRHRLPVRSRPLPMDAHAAICSKGDAPTLLSQLHTRA